ncbi:MAG: element excision factor XisH family protein [bacterium]|nr:element excision factor XisH family protein [bacterium]
MPRLDECHPQVVRALEKAGWTVEPRPYRIFLDRRHTLHIDIEAKQNQQTIIVVEVKCFTTPDEETTDLYIALGQYQVYRGLLDEHNLDFPLYLAVPSQAYYSVFQRMGMPAVRNNRVKLVVVNIEQETIERWIE